ncbi:MAG: hypothetical protein KGQ80_07375 [Bacteroidetes bacterium]|nr:hypothetical protein [Bacteroidota bacterium]
MILIIKFLPEFGRAKWAHVILLMGLVVSLRVFMEANARPLSEWERFKSESSMTAYLNRLVGTYIDPSIFHLSIHIQGDINSEAQGKSPRQQGVVRGKETDPGADEDDMEMLPALPFYNRRIQKTKEIRAEQSNLFPEDQSTLQVTTQSGEVISISRITVNLLFDSLVNEKAVDFITALIHTTLGLDDKRGDAIVVQMVGFPDRSLSSVTNRVMDAQLRSDSTQHSKSLQAIRHMGQTMSLFISIALLMGAGMMLWAIIRLSKARANKEIQTSTAGAATIGAPFSMSESIPSSVKTSSSGEIQHESSTGFSHQQQTAFMDGQQTVYAERARSSLEERIINRPEEVAFILDAWVLESETAIDKILCLLGHRRDGLVALLSRWMCIESVERLTRGLKERRWELLNAADEFESAAKEWFARLHDMEAKGRLSVLHHVDVDSKVRLIEENTADHGWLMVFSLPEAIRQLVFRRLGLETAFGLIRASKKTPEPNALQIRSLEWEITTQIIQKSGQVDPKADLTKLAEGLMFAQPLAQQADFLERLNLIDSDLAHLLRSRTVLWSDLEQFENHQLSIAARILSKEELLHLITIDEQVGRRVLDGRPEREQSMLWEMAELLDSNPEKQDEASRRFLKELATTKKTLEVDRPEPLAQAA